MKDLLDDSKRVQIRCYGRNVALKDAIATIRASVVQIRTAEHVLGTGFFVSSKGHVATALHVVEAAEGEQIFAGLALEVTEYMRANFVLVEAQPEIVDRARDLAVLALARNPFADEVDSGFVIDGKLLPLPHSVAIIDPVRPDDGEAIAISGYPLSNPVLITTSGAIASAWGSDLVDNLDSLYTPPGSPIIQPTLFDLYVADVQGNPGNSGGPAYRVDDGAVIGVCIQVLGADTWNAEGEVGEFAADAGLTVLRPASYLVEHLEAAMILPA